MSRIITSGLFVIIVAAAGADDAVSIEEDQRGFVDRVYRDSDGEHEYVVFLPQGEPPEQGWPVILFLHGAGERGTDGRRQLSVGLGPLVKKRAATYPAIVVFPQSENFDGPILRSWAPGSADARRALAILAEVEADYPTNRAQRILTGWSMGGFGAWGLAATDPQSWSAVVPVSGGGNPEAAANLKGVAIWAFHGADDSIVPVSASRRMVEAVQAAGGRVLYKEVQDGGHDIWLRVYDSDAVLDWMLDPDAGRRDLESIQLPEADTSVLEEQPFVPALIVRRAMTLRVGEEAIRIIATGLPASLGEAGLSGRLDDVRDSVELDGRTFDVRFGDLTYTGELARALIRPRGPDRLSGEFAITNLRLHVGRIVVTDGEVGFTAGPTDVVIGHRQPVWLRVEARPVVDEGRLALKLLRSSFEIPDSNWYVTEPAEIRLQGEWLTPEEVKTAVIGGIYVRRALVEEQVLSGVPALLERFGEEADLSPLERMVAALWPLPVYRPDVRVLPESIATDASGVSLTLSVAVASPDPSPPKSAHVVQASAPAAFEIAPTSDLRVGLAADVLDQISSLLAGTKAARIYASDIPGRPFTELMDAAAVSAALPRRISLAPDADIQTAFSLEAPLHIRPFDGQSGVMEGDGIQMLIEAPRLSMQVSVVGPAVPQETVSADAGSESLPAGPNGRPVPIFTAALDLRQPVALEPIMTARRRPGLRIVWDRDADVTATAEPSRPSDHEQTDVEAMAQLFTQGWERWTAAQAEHVVALPEVSLGSASMTLNELFWEQTRLSAKFTPAATRLINATDAAVTYSVRGPYSRWSEARTLPIDAQVEFKTGTEIRLRPHRHWDFEEVALPAGSAWELREGASRNRFQWIRLDPSSPPAD